MRENALDYRGLFDTCPEPVEGAAMIFNLPPHTQRSTSRSNTRFNNRAQVMRADAPCAWSQPASCAIGAGIGTITARSLA